MEMQLLSIPRAMTIIVCCAFCSVKAVDSQLGWCLQMGIFKIDCLWIIIVYIAVRMMFLHAVLFELQQLCRMCK